MRRSSGFTLIEMLISVAILTVVLLVGTYSYRVFADKWSKKLGKIDTLVTQVRAFTLVNQLLDGIVPLRLYSDKRKGFYFIGQAQELIAISQNGILTTDVPVVFRLSVVTQNSGAISLWYQEAVLDKLLVLETNQLIPFKEPLLLLENLSEANFSYYGWKDFETKSEASFRGETAQKQKWSNTYKGDKRQLHPEALMFNLHDSSGDITIISQFTKNSEILLRDFDGD